MTNATDIHEMKQGIRDQIKQAKDYQQHKVILTVLTVLSLLLVLKYGLPALAVSAILGGCALWARYKQGRKEFVIHLCQGILYDSIGYRYEGK